MASAMHHEPLLRIVKRGESPFKLKMLVRLLAVLLALVVDAMFIYFVTGLNPFAVYTTMFQGTFLRMTTTCFRLKRQRQSS